MEVWRLEIEKSNGSGIRVYGTEDLLRMELTHWAYVENTILEEHKQAKENCIDNDDDVDTTEQYKVRIIHGFTDSADRSICDVAYRLADVIGMTLVRMT